MNNIAPYDFDFAVAGGGPAGSAAAISLARKGHSVVLFERDRFPRFHIGESLLSTTNEYLTELGLMDEIEAAGFPRKWGARLVTHDGASGRGVDFAVVREVTRGQTWQVSRAEFDRMLLERARKSGVEVREEHRITSVEFVGDAAMIAFERPDGSAGSARVRAVVDASGRAGVVARKYGVRKDEPRLANIAIFSHYHGVPRLPDDRPDDIRIVARADAGWFWVIPISKELMSVGVVLPKSLYASFPQTTPEERLEASFADTPVMAELMRNAKREWPVRVEKDFSYSTEKYAGDRWILAGDAGSFLDPVFSTGVTIALESGIEAANELDRALAQNDFSEKQFSAFSRRQKRRYEIFRKYVIGFYTPEFRDLFYDPHPPELIFNAVVTILAGRWNATLRTRLLSNFFFAVVWLQKHVPLTRRRFRRDRDAGYPAEIAHET